MDYKGKQIRIDLIPLHNNTAATGLEVPYLDVMGNDDPITFLFYLNETNGILAQANLHTLQGTKKAGKSAAGLAFIVAALKGNFIGIAPDKENISILWIDTEQDRNTLRKKARAVLSMAEIDGQPDNLKIVALRGVGSPALALDLTLKAIDYKCVYENCSYGVINKRHTCECNPSRSGSHSNLGIVQFYDP